MKKYLFLGISLFCVLLFVPNLSLTTGFLRFILESFGGGLNTSSPPNRLPVSVAQDLENIVFGEGDIITKRPGFTFYGEVPGSGPILSGIIYKEPSGRVWYVFHRSTAIWASSREGEWKKVIEPISAMYPCDFLIYQGELWGINPVDGIFIWSGGITEGVFYRDLPKGQFIEQAHNQIFVAGIPEDPTIVRHSRLSLVDSPKVIGTWPWDYYFRIGHGDGEEITGLKVFDNKVFIFKPNSTWAILGEDIDNYMVRKYSDIYGTISDKSICSYENSLFFLDEEGVIEFNGATFKEVSQDISDQMKFGGVGKFLVDSKVEFDEGVYENCFTSLGGKVYMSRSEVTWDTTQDFESGNYSVWRTTTSGDELKLDYTMTPAGEDIVPLSFNWWLGRWQTANIFQDHIIDEFGQGQGGRDIDPIGNMWDGNPATSFRFVVHPDAGRYESREGLVGEATTTFRVSEVQITFKAYPAREVKTWIGDYLYHSWVLLDDPSTTFQGLYFSLEVLNEELGMTISETLGKVSLPVDKVVRTVTLPISTVTVSVPVNKVRFWLKGYSGRMASAWAVIEVFEIRVVKKTLLPEKLIYFSSGTYESGVYDFGGKVLFSWMKPSFAYWFSSGIRISFKCGDDSSLAGIPYEVITETVSLKGQSGRYMRFKADYVASQNLSIILDKIRYEYSPSVISTYTTRGFRAPETMTSWGNFSASYLGDMNFYFRTSTSEGGLANQSWILIPSGGKIEAPSDDKWIQVQIRTGDIDSWVNKLLIGYNEGLVGGNMGTQPQASIFWEGSYYLSHNASTQTYNDRVSIYDDRRRWTKFSGVNATVLLGEPKPGKTLHFGSSQDGKVYRFIPGLNTDIGEPLKALWKSGFMHFGSPEKWKRFMSIHTVGRPKDGDFVDISYAVDRSTITEKRRLNFSEKEGILRVYPSMKTRGKEFTIIFESTGTFELHGGLVEYEVESFIP